MKSKPATKMVDQAPMTGEELGERLLQSLRDLNAGRIGRITWIHINDVVKARHRTRLTHADFARALNISARTLRDWEHDRRAPTGPAKVLIRIALEHPRVVRAMLK